MRKVSKLYAYEIAGIWSRVESKCRFIYEEGIYCSTNMLSTHLSLTGDGCGLNASTTAVMISVRKTRLVRTKRHFAKFLMFASVVL